MGRSTGIEPVAFRSEVGILCFPYSLKFSDKSKLRNSPFILQGFCHTKALTKFTQEECRFVISTDWIFIRERILSELVRRISLFLLVSQTFQPFRGEKIPSQWNTPPDPFPPDSRALWPSTPSNDSGGPLRDSRTWSDNSRPDSDSVTSDRGAVFCEA